MNQSHIALGLTVTEVIGSSDMFGNRMCGTDSQVIGKHLQEIGFLSVEKAEIL